MAGDWMTCGGLDCRDALLGGGAGFQTEGIVAGTRVATRLGWRPVEALAPGDRLLTFDNGMVELLAVRHRQASADAADWPVAHWPRVVPAGLLGNRQPLRLLPDQLVMLECDAAEAMFGDPFALLPARALDGWRGIAPAAPEPGEHSVVLGFAAEQVIYGASAVLLHCPSVRSRPHLPDTADPGPAAYAPLPLEAARLLVAWLIAEETGAALRRAVPVPAQAAFEGDVNRP